MRFINHLKTAIFILGVIIYLLVLTFLGEKAKSDWTALIFMFALVAIVVMPTPTKQWLQRRRARQATQQRWDLVNSWLGVQNANEVITASPYSYDWWPDGDDNWLVWNDLTKAVVHGANSPDLCKLWILEQVRSRNDLDSSKQTSNP